MDKRRLWLALWMVWLLTGCGGGGGGTPGTKVGGNIQGFTVPANSKVVLLSLSSNPVFKLGEAIISGSSFNLTLPELPNVDALGAVFEAPKDCTGVTVQPAGAEAVWAGFSLEVSGQPAGEVFAQSGEQLARYIYAEEAATVSGTLSCPQATVAGVRAQAADGTTFNLNLKQGWNLVLTDSKETSFSSTAPNTNVTWSAATPNDLSGTTGADGGSVATRLKGSLGVQGYGLALQMQKPGSGSPSTPLANPTSTSSSDGAFDIALPATINSVLLGVASGLGAANCDGTLNISNPAALLGQAALSVYRGNQVVGNASLVTYSTTVGWWYASVAFNVTGQEACGSGDSVDITKYNLSLQAGWNLVLRLDDRVQHTSQWTSLTSVPASSKWLLELEDAGIGVSPGPFGGADKGSTASRMFGKLGGWTDTQAASLKVESDAGVGLASGPLSASGEFDLTLPANVDAAALEPLELTQDCGAGVTQTPASPTGVKASLQPDRNDTPLGTIAVGGRGFTVDWVYASTAVQVSGTENCPSGDGGDEQHRYSINFVQGWNLLIEQVFFKDGLEYTEHKSGSLPAGSQWFFDADKDPGLPDAGSTTTSLKGTVGAGFANQTLRLRVGSTQITSLALGANGDVSTNLPPTVSAAALVNLSPSRSGCAGSLSVSPASTFGVLSLEVWDGAKFKSAVEVTNEDSDGALEKLYWWYLNQDATVSGTQSCSGQINRTFKYNLSLKAGWNLVLEHEEEDPSGDRDTKYSVVSKVPEGTQWGTN